MERDAFAYKNYIEILKEELLPAMGCTEPIAIAYAAATARAALGKQPERVLVEVSGNIIKNVKSVVVPHTGGLRGIRSAVAAGVVAGDHTLALEVISHVTDAQIDEIKRYAEQTPMEVRHVDTDEIFDIMLTLHAGEDSVFIRIAGYHTNIVSLRRNGSALIDRAPGAVAEAGSSDRAAMNVEAIVDFAECVCLADVSDLLERQIDLNMAIAKAGLAQSYGANIGKVLLSAHPDDIYARMRAYAAAASDARMNGCELPVVINSGSGNQGITASVPVIVYAEYAKASHEALLRALCVSNLVTIHLKTGVGRLSAYCGAVSAGCGAAAGVAYLLGGRFDMIAHTVVNALAMESGIICDGAKASCAAKIASAVDAGLLGLDMYRQGNQFLGGDGIVKKGVENTIVSVGRLAREGMRQTDTEILRLMLEP